MPGNWRFSNSRPFVRRRRAGGRAPWPGPFSRWGRAAAPRAPQRIINQASQGPGQRRPFTPPLLPPGILLFLKTAASWAAEKRQLCGRRSGGPRRREGALSLRSEERAGLGRPGARGGQGARVFFLKAARLLRKPRDFHGALEKSAMEMVMGPLRLVLRKGEGDAFRPAERGTAPGWEAPRHGWVGRPGGPHLYQALPGSSKSESRNKGLSLGSWSLQ